MGARISKGVGASLGSFAIVALLMVCAVPSSASRPGDSNCNGEIGADDVYVTFENIFSGEPPMCISADVNNDTALSAADVVSALTYTLAPPAAGPVVTYLGLAAADGAALSPVGRINGADVFVRPAGQGFKVVVEGRPGGNGAAVGQAVSNVDSLNRRPDVWMESSSILGDGSPAVCDGGVPGIEPPVFDSSQRITNLLNDLSCNMAVATSARFACTQDRFGTAAMLGIQSQVQFCMEVSRTIAFPEGETVLSVMLRDTAGTLGPLQQIIVRIGNGPFPPTATPTRTPSRTVAAVTPTLTAPPTFTRTPSFTVRPTASRTVSATRSSTPSASATWTRLPSVTATRTNAPATATATLAATASHTATLPPTDPPTQTPTGPRPPTATASRTGSPTRSPTLRPTPTVTSTLPSSATPTRTTQTVFTATATVTRSRTATATRGISASPTRTATAAPGPRVSYVGLALSDDLLLAPSFTTPEGIPVYVRPLGFAFSIIVEGQRGATGDEVGRDTFVDDLSAFPDLQIQATNPLGNGSDVVCDNSGASAGGVPGINPPSFELDAANISVLNDFGCRFVDGTGATQGRSPVDACTRVPPNDDYGFAADSAVQFCATIGPALQFPPGDTLISVRLLDQATLDAAPGTGVPGPVAHMIIRVGSATPPTPTWTETPVATATSTQTRTPTLALPSATRSATSSFTIVSGPSPTRTATRTPTTAVATATAVSGSATPTRTRTPTGTVTRTPTASGSPTRTATRTRTATPSPTTEPRGPLITFFGIARFDGTLVDPEGTTGNGIVIYRRPVGAGFTIIVEGRPGLADRAVGSSSFDNAIGMYPDLQIVSSNVLGNGSTEVCDYRFPNAGGIPAIAGANLDAADIATVNDFACRFRDGLDDPRGRGANDGCVLFTDGSFGFAQTQSTIQFCAAVDRIIEFPPGDTLLTVRLRDVNDNLGPTAQMILRIGL